MPIPPRTAATSRPATQPLGVEVQQTTFGFNRQGPLANTVFIRYRIINKGGNQLSNMFVSQWCDPDLGGFADDLVGCDTTPVTGLRLQRERA
jgi:hypothetical protein